MGALDDLRKRFGYDKPVTSKAKALSKFKKKFKGHSNDSFPKTDSEKRHYQSKYKRAWND